MEKANAGEFLLLCLPHIDSDSCPSSTAMNGHRTSVFVLYTEVVAVAGRTSRSSAGKTKEKTKEKTVQSVKTDHIVLEGSSRVNFVNAALAVHDLATQYQAGQLSGPAVKIWWTGAGYGLFHRLLCDYSVSALVVAKQLPQPLRMTMTSRWRRPPS